MVPPILEEFIVQSVALALLLGLHPLTVGHAEKHDILPEVVVRVEVIRAVIARRLRDAELIRFAKPEETEAEQLLATA